MGLTTNISTILRKHVKIRVRRINVSAPDKCPGVAQGA